MARRRRSDTPSLAPPSDEGRGSIRQYALTLLIRDLMERGHHAGVRSTPRNAKRLDLYVETEKVAGSNGRG